MEEIYRKMSDEEFSDIKSRILYEDNHIIIINKYSGEIVQADKTGDESLGETLKTFIAIKDNKPGRVYIGVPHRLDRPVSGISMFAKTSKALERLNKMFREGEIHKYYWALTENCPEPKEGELHDWIRRNQKQNKSYICNEGDNGAKEAKLKYHLIKPTKKYFLVEIELLTGRHHQIRCQLANMNCKIKGDLKYGSRRSNPDGSISLHARYIKFIHPIKKEEICVTAPTYMEKY